MNFLLPASDLQAQALLHDKRLKTNKQDKKTTRKKLFDKRDGEDSESVKTEPRTIEPSGRKKDNRSLGKPSYEAGSHRLDTDRKDYDRPISPETNYGGNRKSKKRKIARKDKEAATYTGNQKTSSNVIKPQRGSAASSGGTKGRSQKQVESDFKGSSEDMQQFSGRIKSRKSKKENSTKNATRYSGNLEYGSNINMPLRKSSYSKTLIKRKSEKQIKRDLERDSQNMHQFSGRIRVGKVKKDDKRDQKATEYTGNLKYGSNVIKPQRGSSYTKKVAKGKSEKQIAKAFEEKSREMHQYAGDKKIRVSNRKVLGNEFGKTLKIPAVTARTKHFEKLSKKVHQYGGDIRIKKSKYKNLHPSVSYLEGKKKSSIEKKEKLRKRKIFWFKFWKNGDQPKSVKEKPVKPKYDSRESEIWYD